MNKPTVSQLLQLLDKPALLGWANKIGLEGITLADYRKKSTKGGTDLHKEIELYVNDKIPFKDQETQKRFDELFADKEIISMESKIETDIFRGRMDLEMKFKGKSYVVDFKSSKSGVYFENILQLVAYRMAKKSDCIAVIQIPEMIFKPIEIIDHTPYESILEALYIIWECKQSTINYIK